MALRKIALMHKFFGICEGHTCGECSNLVEEPYHGKMYRKCKVYVQSNSVATDWAKRYLACGMFNKTYKGRRYVELVKPARTNQEEAQRIELEGQMKLEV